MVSLVPYDESFADSLAPFVISFWNTHHSTFSLEQAKNTLKEWNQGEYHLFCIMYNNQPVGFLRTHNTSPTVCWVDDIYVDEPYRSKGIATAAIRHTEEKMQAEGTKSFCMEVVPDNVAAMRLYHRLGYDRLSMVVIRKDSDDFETERIETIADLPFRVRHFD